MTFYQIPSRPDCSVCGVRIDAGTICDPCSDLAAEAARDVAIRPARASIPKRFRWASFTAAEFPERVRGYVGAARDWELRGNLVLIGPSGSGKTSVACAVLRRFLDAASSGGNPNMNRARHARFHDAYSLAKARALHPLGHGEAPEIASAMRASLLVLDELGSEVHNNTAVAEVIHERHARELPTVATTWLDATGLATKYGDGIARRLLEHSTVIKLGG